MAMGWWTRTNLCAAPWCSLHSRILDLFFLVICRNLFSIFSPFPRSAQKALFLSLSLSFFNKKKQKQKATEVVGCICFDIKHFPKSELSWKKFWENNLFYGINYIFVKYFIDKIWQQTWSTISTKKKKTNIITYFENLNVRLHNIYVLNG